MTVLIASDTPPAVRGMLKRWFLEPRPNVFVGNFNPRVVHEVVTYVLRLAPQMSLLVLNSANNSQGFTIQSFGQPDRTVINICGLQLIAEKGPQECPPPTDTCST